jgi:hypothetical protein
MTRFYNRPVFSVRCYGIDLPGIYAKHGEIAVCHRRFNVTNPCLTNPAFGQDFCFNWMLEWDEKVLNNSSRSVRIIAYCD